MVERDRSRSTSFTNAVDMELIMCFVEQSCSTLCRLDVYVFV